MLNKFACVSVLSDLLKNDKAVTELNSEGFGKEIVEALDEHGYFPAASLIKWEYVIRNNFQALVLLSKFFLTTKLKFILYSY